MRKLNKNQDNLYTDSNNSEGYRLLAAVPAPRVRRRAHKIQTYNVFISHRYARSDEYARLVRMLDRAAERDFRWRWKNLSIPREATIMTQKEAKQGGVYEQRIRQRMRKVDVVLLIDRAEWLENVNSLYLELVEGTHRHHRPAVPIINVLPRGVDPKSLKYTGPGVTTVKWHPTSIIQAVYRHAIPASASAKRLRLRRGKSAEEARIIWLTRAECAERACIAAALKANAGHLARAATVLGMSRSALRRRIIAYLMGGQPLA